MKKILDILKDSLFTFGILILIFSSLIVALGNTAADSSAIFSFYNQALSLSLTFQLLGLSVITNVLKAFFNSNFMIKRVFRILRHIILFVLIFVILIGMILIFNWFDPKNQIPWILTTVAFVISFTVSIVITELKQKKEDKQLQDALKMIKN